MSEIRCFLLERTDLARRSLRRYTPSEKGNPCPISGYHNASVSLGGEIPYVSQWNGKGDDSWPHDDPRWPTHCACGYEFQPDDQWQHNLDRLFRRPEDGQLFRHQDAPIGAMARGVCSGPTSAQALARGVRGSDDGANLDHLSVKLPDGYWWCIDEPASRDYQEGGSGWERSGEPPNVTASPSILTGCYHGWLRNGVLVEC